MANIFTRKAVSAILADENLSSEERTEKVFSLYGQALDDGYLSKSAAQAAQNAAVEAAKADAIKGIQAPDIKESEEYKALAGQFDAYKAMQTARTSEDFSAVKPKFFETVYNMIDRADGAKPVKDQLSEIAGKYEEYFIPETPPADNQPKNTPQYSQAPGRTGTNANSKEEELYNKLKESWK